MSDLLTIDGVQYDVDIIDMKRSAEFLYKYAERTVDGVLNSELIGVYFNYQLVFAKNVNETAYKALWAKLTEPTEFHTVVLPDEDGVHTFSAYFSNIKDTFVKVKDTRRYISGLSVNIIARSPART
jgi:hypothetical protein